MPSLDPSEEVAHIALEATEKAIGAGAKIITTGVDVAGKAVVGLAQLLTIIVNAEYRSKGFVPKKYFDGKPTAYFTIMQKDLLEFSRAAKQYGIAYSAIIDKTNTNPKAEVDIIIQDSNAALVQRIMERYGFNMPDINMDDVAAAARDTDKAADAEAAAHNAQSEDKAADAKATEHDMTTDQSPQENKVPDIDIMRSDGFINLLEEEQVDISTKGKEDAGKEKHPTQARTEGESIQFAPSSETTRKRPSVRDTLETYRQEERREAAKQSPAKVRGYEHVQTLARKQKSKEGRER